MCFKNLPIEFDENGKAYLKAGVRDPYAYQTRSLDDQADRIQELLARNGFIKSVDFDPVTRVAGALARSLLSDLRLQASVAGLSLGLGDATKAALGALLAQTAPAIDEALDGLLALLGLRIGEADVRVTSVSCGRPALVQ